METKKTNIRMGVIGVGVMGRHHVRLLSQSHGVELMGLFDVDSARANSIAIEYGCRSFSSINDLLNHIEAVIVAAPTTLHWDIGKVCLGRGIHTLIEKPLAHSLFCAERMVEIARTTGAILMVGHVERYNPAVGQLIEMLKDQPEKVISIDVRRLTPFDGTRCLDVDVLQDLLIHDIDLALEIADSPVLSVSARGGSVFSNHTDFAHTQVLFENGTVAVFWTAKCSPRKMRLITVTTPSRYFEADTLTGCLTVYRAEDLPHLESGQCRMGNIRCEEIEMADEEPLRREIDDFIRALTEKTRPTVDGERAVRSMRVLELISGSIAKDAL